MRRHHQLRILRLQGEQPRLLLARPMAIRPISTRVNKPDNDDAAILEALAAEEPSLL